MRAKTSEARSWGVFPFQRSYGFENEATAPPEGVSSLHAQDGASKAFSLYCPEPALSKDTPSRDEIEKTCGRATDPPEPPSEHRSPSEAPVEHFWSVMAATHPGCAPCTTPRHYKRVPERGSPFEFLSWAAPPDIPNAACSPFPPYPGNSGLQLYKPQAGQASVAASEPP